MKKIALISILALLLAFAIGCSNGNNDQETYTPEVEATPDAAVEDVNVPDYDEAEADVQDDDLADTDYDDADVDVDDDTSVEQIGEFSDDFYLALEITSEAMEFLEELLVEFLVILEEIDDMSEEEIEDLLGSLMLIVEGDFEDRMVELEERLFELDLTPEEEAELERLFMEEVEILETLMELLFGLLALGF